MSMNTFRELVSIPVPPGAELESQSGLQMN